VPEERGLGQTRSGAFQQKLKIDWNPQWQRKSLRVIVLVQQSGGRKILGAVELPAEKISNLP
jgi:hypothetical protein